jgi:hypothetical protein
MEKTECSETSAYNIQTPGNYPEENIQQENIYIEQLSNQPTAHNINTKNSKFELSSESVNTKSGIQLCYK